MVRAIFYMHQNSGACAGMCTQPCAHAIAHIKETAIEEMQKTVIVSQRERNTLTCFNEKVQNNNVKMETFVFHPPACLPLF